MVGADLLSNGQAENVTPSSQNEIDYELRDHQIKALKKLKNGKILWGGVGTGKSRVAAAYYHLNEAHKRVYVITTAKKRDSFDWQEEFYRLNIGPATGPTDPSTGSELGKSKRKRRGPDGASGLLLEGDPGNDEGDRSRGAISGVYPWVLTIDSWNNIAKYANVAGAFFIFDEQRLVGAGDWTRKFLRIAKHNNWILLSGTPGDTWMDYIPVFVANNFYKNRTAFKREHVVYNTFTKFPKVDRYINVGKLMRQRAELLVEMPYERHTKRRIVEVPLKFDKEALEMVLKKRWNIYENRPLRDVAEMFSVGRKVVNSDRSRIEMVEELWKKHPKLIVFYNFNYELEILRSLELNPCEHGSKSGTTSTSQHGSSKTSSPIHPSNRLLTGIINPSSITSHASSGGSRDGLGRISSKKSSSETLRTGSPADSATTSTHGTPITIAEWNGHKHQPVPTTKRWLYLVQYTAGAEGWNCIETNAMIMYSRNYSWKVFEQACGRTDRLNTPFQDLWYYDFTSESWIDLAIGRALKAKQVFNEAKYSGMFK